MIKLCSICHDAIDDHLKHDCVRTLMHSIRQLEKGIDILLRRDGCAH